MGHSSLPVRPHTLRLGAFKLRATRGQHRRQTYNPGPLHWISIASSADGTKLVAAAGNYDLHNQPGHIYTSMDAGRAWKSNSLPELSWTAVACSADGCSIVATSWTDFQNGGPIYVYKTTPTSSLEMVQDARRVMLSWAVSSSNFILQQNSDLTTNNWT